MDFCASMASIVTDVAESSSTLAPGVRLSWMMRPRWVTSFVMTSPRSTDVSPAPGTLRKSCSIVVRNVMSTVVCPACVASAANRSPAMRAPSASVTNWSDRRNCTSVPPSPTVSRVAVKLPPAKPPPTVAPSRTSE